MTNPPEPGEAVYDGDGELVGHIERTDTDVIHVVPADHVADSTPSEAARGYGEADLVWQCGQCGEIGAIETMPDRCPSCQAPREEIYYLTQD